MNSISRVVQIVARRLTVNLSISMFLRSSFYLLCLFAFIALADRLFYLGFSPYMSLAVGLAALAPYAIMNAWLRPVSRDHAAIAIDRRLGLHERLSTALSITDIEQPANQAVLADALRHAESIKPERHFPYQYPSEVKYMAVPALVIVLIWSVVPSFDLLKREAKILEEKQVKQQLDFEAKELEKRTKKLREKIDEIQSVKSKDLVKKLEMASENLKKAKDKKEAFLTLSELGDKLKNRQEDLQKLMDSKKRFQPDGLAKMTKEMQEAIKEGDYDAAKRQLEHLKEKLAEQMKKEGKMDEKSLAEMEKLGRELEQLSKDLEDSGLEELAKAFKNVSKSMVKHKDGQALTKEQMAELMKKLEEAGDELAQLDEMKEEFEMLELALDELEIAKNGLTNQCQFDDKCPVAGQKLCRKCGTDECECCNGFPQKCKFNLSLSQGGKGGNGVGLQGGRGGQGQGKGPGNSGGSGQGQGDRQRGELNDAGFVKSKIKGQLGKGPILGSFMVKGLPPKGESNVEYKNAITNYKAAAEEALDKERIPANYRELVKDYFEAIENPVVGQ